MHTLKEELVICTRSAPQHLKPSSTEWLITVIISVITDLSMCSALHLYGTLAQPIGAAHMQKTPLTLANVTPQDLCPACYAQLQKLNKVACWDAPCRHMAPMPGHMRLHGCKKAPQYAEHKCNARHPATYTSTSMPDTPCPTWRQCSVN
jgi:hypothetical protein